ncbi:hypothetical protein NHX12_001349 [Muraenolepis orangiensis]|uniref:Uncharacterized protein n=1 Tax=Muraenolepis orangiensis TaxID=630683 RepID=A0A9Q0DZP2_9TELE|nr:hypothetical protein NHX12_001349 [Muraenolepis orangiensis]
MDWPELLDHPFWAQVKEKEEGEVWSEEEVDREEGEGDDLHRDDSPSSRCVVIFRAHESNPGNTGDTATSVQALLYTDTDLTVTAVIDNPKVLCAITDLLRDNLRNNKVKQFLLPPLGELLYRIASQDDAVVQHMAAKTVENIATIVTDSAHNLVTAETGPALWYLFTHSTVEAVRITAISVMKAILPSLVSLAFSRNGLIEVVVKVLRQAALHHLDGDGQPGVLLSYLELLHNILRHASAVVRSALRSQRLSCPATVTDAAEKLLLANRPLNHLNTHLILLLSTHDQEVGEESVQCLSLLVQLYGGVEGPDCLTPDCLRGFLGVLRSDGGPRMHRTTLRVLRRLVQTSDGGDWLECSEGVELVSRLQDLADSSRSHGEAGAAVQAAEILQEIHAL